MHLRSNFSRIFLIIFSQTLIVLNSSLNVYRLHIPRKCCSSGHIFDEQLSCINQSMIGSTKNSSLQHLIVKNAYECDNNESLIYNRTLPSEDIDYVTFHIPESFCIEDFINGTKVLAKCPDHSFYLDWGEVIMWGAQTYMYTNFAHVCLCLLVVTIYLSVPALKRGLYNRAVVRHNICLLMHGVVLQLLGFCELRNCQFSNYMIIFFWLCLQYFTIATIFWLNVICFDMTLVITRFHWIAGSGSRNDSTDNRKLLLYGLFAWGGSLLPTLMAGISDYVPGIPKDFVLKPNYINFRKGPSSIVNIYFFSVPTFTLLLNNVLFIFTTYKIIKIQRSTKIATRNQTNLLKKRYFLFLRLYLLMGAPWFFGLFFATLNNLIILKMCRLMQPSLWLLMLATHKAVIQRLKSLCLRYRRPHTTVATIST